MVHMAPGFRFCKASEPPVPPEARTIASIV
jgi:hypothetical protein